MVTNRINFTLIEEGCGIISRPEIIENIVARISIERHKVAKKLGLYNGDNELIVKKICNLDAQVKGYYDKKLEHFDVVKEMKKLDDKFIAEIIRFFGVYEQIEIKNNSIVILTQHFSNLNVMSFEEQKNIYRLIADYFSQNYNLVFKPHPDDLLFYDIIFPESTLIRSRFPSELIPFVFTTPPEAIMTITSTAINSLLGYFEDPISFSYEFERNYTITHTYYSIIKVISELNEDYSIYSMNGDKILLENLMKYSDFNLDGSIEHFEYGRVVDEKSILIIDDIHQEAFDNESKDVFEVLESVDEDTIVIFPNSEEKFIFYNYPNKKIFEDIVPIEIVRQNLSDNHDIHSKMIYIYTKKGTIKNMINELVFEKVLKHSNHKLSVSKLSEEQLKIKALEGILEATEKKLDHYIKLEIELREQLNKNKK